MWRAFFLAVGISLIILGTECLVFDKAVVTRPNRLVDVVTEPTAPTKRKVVPEEWWPWSLMSVGFIVTMWSITMKRE